MCGIIALIFKNSSNNDFDNKINFYEKYRLYLLKSLDQLSRRGSDGFGMSINNKCLYFQTKDELKKYTQNNFFKEFENIKEDYIIVYIHILHAIQGRVLQPIYSESKNSTLVFNGEIYNYKDINKELSISTHNDSSTLIEYLNSFDSIFLCNNFENIVNRLDADFAFIYQRNKKVYLCRDYLGVKPLWYEFNKEEQYLMISSERKILSKKSLEINPRTYAYFDIENFDLTIKKRIQTYNLEIQNPNINLKEVYEVEYEVAKKEVFSRLNKAVEKRTTFSNKKKTGLLFSGGVDSTVLALLLKKHEVDFVCYNAELDSDSLQRAEDSIYSEEIAQVYKLNLIIEKISQDELEALIIETILIIESSDYIKVSVALPFLAACKRAREDGVDIIFSGLGSEEIFAGYRRHRQVDNVNLECLNGLNLLHFRDLYRDDVISMSQTQELRVPFLDNDLIKYCLSLSPKFKLDVEQIKRIENDVYKKPHLNTKIRSKIILRDIAIDYLKLDKRFANRQKKAAQYGSKFDKGINRLAKNKEMSKQEYLDYLVECNDLYVFDNYKLS